MMLQSVKIIEGLVQLYNITVLLNNLQNTALKFF